MYMYVSLCAVSVSACIYCVYVIKCIYFFFFNIHNDIIPQACSALTTVYTASLHSLPISCVTDLQQLHWLFMSFCFVSYFLNPYLTAATSRLCR